MCNAHFVHSHDFVFANCFAVNLVTQEVLIKFQYEGVLANIFGLKSYVKSIFGVYE